MANNREEILRLKADFESQASQYRRLKLSIHILKKGQHLRNLALTRPHHAISLWQFMGYLGSDFTPEEFVKREPTNFGISGAEFEAFGVLEGEEETLKLFLRMAERAGTLVDESTRFAMMKGVMEQFKDPDRTGKPVFTRNPNPLAVWLNLVLICLVHLQPMRYQRETLSVDPFTASLSVFDLYWKDLIAPVATPSQIVMKKIKVLIVLSNQAEPGKARLYLDNEVKAIKQKVNSAKHRDLIEIDTLEAATIGDLIAKLNQYEPDVLHFSGHGSQDGQLVFCADAGGEQFISKDNLLTLFQVAATSVQVGFFSACFSESVADTVIQSVPCAIGMRTEIGDDLATTFSSHFYQAVASGRSIENAFLQGRLSLGLGIGIREDEAEKSEKSPQLRVKEGVDASSLTLISGNPR